MVEEKLLEICKELEEKNKRLEKEIQELKEQVKDYKKRNYELECLLDEEDFNEDMEENFDDYEENEKSYLDFYRNPFGLSMKEVFQMGEAAKSAMSPAESQIYDMMKKALGINEEDLK